MDITDQQFHIDDDYFDCEINTGAVTQQTSDSKVQTGSDDDWKITTTGGTTISKSSSNSSTTIKQNQISTGGSISIGSGNISSTGRVQIGPDEEKMEKLRDIAKKQLEKIDQLRDILIDWIIVKTPSREKKIQWKRDLDQIAEYKRNLEDALSENSGVFWGDEVIREDQILDPLQLDKINDIYRRWT